MNAPTDPALFDDWHPVARATAVAGDAIVAARLLDHDLALWRDPAGILHAWEDRCPHRGMRFSRARQDGAALICAYHGWRFEADGACSAIPALPDTPPPAQARARAFAVTEQYGLVWVCIGTPAGAVLPFPEYADPHLRKVICGPYPVASSGPRIVENFLDMAHFSTVHTGILGAPEHPAIPDYEVDAFDDGSGYGAGQAHGILATRCLAWQPQTNSLAHGGSMVEYTYRVTRPLTAILTKLPAAQSDFREAISLHVQPVGQEQSQAWIILAMTNFVHTEDELRAFQDRIFLQDQPIVENQVPLRLPLAPEAELPVRCDRMSQSYRRFLRGLGVRYGVIA